MFHDELRRKWTYAFLKVSSGFDPRKIPKSSSAISGFSSRPQTRVSNIILTDDQCGLFDLLASVKLSSFCPCFVLLLVWALLFNNSCKSKLIGGKSIWKLFAKWPTPTDRESKCLCMRRIFTFFTLSRRSEEDGRNKGLSFISLTLVGGTITSLHIVTLLWRPMVILCQQSLLLSQMSTIYHRSAWITEYLTNQNFPSDWMVFAAAKQSKYFPSHSNNTPQRPSNSARDPFQTRQEKSFWNRS